MSDKVSYDDRDIQWWRQVCSRMAIALALVLFASDITGVWLSSENRSLDAFKKTNLILKESNNNVTEKLKTQTKKQAENEIQIKELEKELFDLKVENATLKALLATEKQ